MSKLKNKSKFFTSMLLAVLCVISLALGFLFFNSEKMTANADTNISSLFTFDPINGGEEYSVRAADRNTISVANIPYLYNGKKVTEIANNGFAVCKNLTKVTIPKTIKRIGNNAFMGCTNLTTVYTFESLENETMQIGANAFLNCNNPNMNNIVIPKTVDNVSSGAFKNVKGTIHVKLSKSIADEKYDSNWVDSSNQVVYNSEYSIDQVNYQLNDAGTAYYVDTQGFFDYPDLVEIEHYYEGKPVEYISTGAFSGNAIKKLVIKESNDGHKIKINNSAFFYSCIEEIDCGNSVIFEDSIGSQSEFALSACLKKVVLPNSMTKINESMFDSCNELEDIEYKNADYKNTIPANVGNFVIEKDAFKDCTSLGTLVNGIKEFTIPSNVTVVKENAFTGWKSDQKINIEFKVKPDGWSPVWCGENIAADLAWQKFVVSFYDYSGNLYATESREYGESIIIPNVPEIPGYYSKWSNSLRVGQNYTVTADVSFRAERNGEKPLSECYKDGTYYIYTVNQFRSVRQYATNGYKFYLCNSINLGNSAWTPIPEFKGEFNGGGCSISGLYINVTSEGNYGLFGINSGTIGRLTVYGYIKVNSGSGFVYAGLIAGRNNSFMNYCYSRASGYRSIQHNGTSYSLGIESLRSESVVGGLVGYNADKVFNSTNYADIYGSGYIGGAAGYSTNLISSITNYGDLLYSFVDGNNRAIGGIVGINDGWLQNSCTNRGNLYYTNSKMDHKTLAPEMGTMVGRNTKNAENYWFRGHMIYNYGNIYGTDVLFVYEWTTGIWPFKQNHSNNQAQYIGGNLGRTLSLSDSAI